MKKAYQPLKMSVTNYYVVDIVRTSTTPQDLEETQDDFFYQSSSF